MQFKKILPWILVIIWMSVIFYFSHQPAVASNGLSTGITEKLLHLINDILPNLELNIETVNHVVRKGAHFSVYLLLGIFVVLGFKSTDIKENKVVFLSLLVCVLYATSDEIHQLFVPGRSGEIRDTVIDSAGALVGIISSKQMLSLLTRTK